MLYQVNSIFQCTLFPGPTWQQASNDLEPRIRQRQKERKREMKKGVLKAVPDIIITSYTLTRYILHAQASNRASPGQRARGA